MGRSIYVGRGSNLGRGHPLAAAVPIPCQKHPAASTPLPHQDFLINANNSAQGRYGKLPVHPKKVGLAPGFAPSPTTPTTPTPPSCTTPSTLNSHALRREQARANASESKWRAKKRVIRMLMVIVALFFLCWMPLYSANTWKAFDLGSAHRALSGAPISFIHLLSYSSACVNPLIYCFMNTRFRGALLATCGCCCPGYVRKAGRRSLRRRFPGGGGGGGGGGGEDGYTTTTTAGHGGGGATSTTMYKVSYTAVSSGAGMN
ncbi:unnamed protein product [Arctogadus glacialis]